MAIEAAFLGTVGRDSDLKVSKAGKPYLRLSVRDGYGDAAQWVSVMYFGADAAELAPLFTKDSRVYVEGTIQLSTWEQAGKQRAGLTVLSSYCRLAQIGRNRPKRERSTKHQNTTDAAPDHDFHSDPVPF
jgi:single-stranded DNA-binding protein